MKTCHRLRQLVPFVQAFATLASAVLIFCSVAIAERQLSLTRRALVESSHQQSMTRKAGLLNMQQTIRDRYFEVHRTLEDLNAFDYPGNGKHYTAAERTLIRRYWSEVASNEYFILTIFQEGLLTDEWQRIYSDLIRNAFSVRILAEEWCHYKTLHAQDSDWQMAFEQEVDRLGGNRLNCGKMNRDRDRDIELAASTSETTRLMSAGR